MRRLAGAQRRIGMVRTGPPFSNQVHDCPTALSKLESSQRASLPARHEEGRIPPRVASIAQPLLARSPSSEAQSTNRELCSKLSQSRATPELTSALHPLNPGSQISTRQSSASCARRRTATGL